MLRRWWIIAGLWIVALAGAAALDVAVGDWAGRNRPTGLALRALRILKAPGDFRFTLAIALALGLWHAWKWRASLMLCAGGIASGLAYTLAKWAVGRTRPNKGIAAFDLAPFKNGLIGLIQSEKNRAFPSGHACLAFATATMLALLLPRWRAAFYALATLVALERVIEGAHYPSDIVAGAALGMASAYAVWQAARPRAAGAPLALTEVKA